MEWVSILHTGAYDPRVCKLGFAVKTKRRVFITGSVSKL